VPAKGGERAYALLREALKETGLVGIATIVLRDAQHLAALEVAGDAMVLTLMRYAEELVDVRDFHFPTLKDVRKPELQMARALVENLADTWDPSKYTDEYRANLMKIIKAKLKGKEPHLVEHVEPQHAEVVDLMERLRQSLQGAGGAASRRPARAKKATARGKKRPHAA
jgi:DNA end-binding protein Ku